MKLVGCGQNADFQVGVKPDGTNSHGTAIVLTPTQIPLTAGDITCISAGVVHSVFVTKQGDVYAAGDDTSFNIGSNKSTVYSSPTLINLGTKISQAAAGYTYTVYLTFAHSLIVCCQQYEGERIKSILPNKRIVKVFGGFSFPAVIDDKGDAYIFNKDDFKKTPLRLSGIDAMSIAICDSYLCILSMNGSVKCMPSYRSELNSGKEMLKETKVKQISGFYNHMIALTEDGVYVYGINEHGQFGDGMEVRKTRQFIKVKELDGMRIKQVCAGYLTSYVITEDGVIYSCGFNQCGDLMLRHVHSPVINFTKVELPLKACWMVSGSAVFVMLEENKAREPMKIKSQNKAAEQEANPFELPEEHPVNPEIIIKAQAAKIQQLEEKLQQYEQNEKAISETVLDPRNYKVIKKIGRGSSGDVFLVKEAETGILFAEKTYDKNLDFDDVTAEKFMREIDICCGLQHKCIVKYHGFFLPTNENPALIFLEYIKGGSLQNLLNNPPKEWTNTRKAIIILEIAAGMEYLHNNDIIHRDLKPSNILITERFDAKICDFSESMILDPDATQTKGVGTMKYMSPEMMNNKPYGKETDVYSFGIIVFYIVTGRLPKVTIQDFLNGKRDTIPSSIKDFMRLMISKSWASDPAQRPTFSQIVKSLERNNFMVFDDVDHLYLRDKYEMIGY